MRCSETATPPMSLERVERFLRETMGLDAASIGISSIERAVGGRQHACALGDVDSYWEHLRSSDIERQQLIEAIVVPETWFFRGVEAFAALGGAIWEEWERTHPLGALRLLSIPSSTGEEPYSMVMALMDAGIPPSRFCVDAVDISERALAHAHHGAYGKSSFRGANVDFRDRYFDASARGYQLKSVVRDQVRFHQANLFAADFLPGTERYDIIWCRNLLIYFDRPTQDRAIEVLSRLLTHEGFLFVGPSETAVLSQHAFRSAKL